MHKVLSAEIKQDIFRESFIVVIMKLLKFIAPDVITDLM